MWDFCEENRSESFSSLECLYAVYVADGWNVYLQTGFRLQ